MPQRIFSQRKGGGRGAAILFGCVFLPIAVLHTDYMRWGPGAPVALGCGAAPVGRRMDQSPGAVFFDWDRFPFAPKCDMLKSGVDGQGRAGGGEEV